MIRGHWPDIESDLQDCGVDVGDDALMAARSWRWLRSRITGLLTKPPMIEPFSGRLMYLTRLQQAVLPQPEAEKRAEK